MMNPFPLLMADLRRSFFGSLGILVLLAFAFSATIAVSLFERGFRNAGAEVAQDTDLVVGAPGNGTSLVLNSVFLLGTEVLPLMPMSVFDKLQGDPRVAAASPLVFSDHYQDAPIVGVGPAFPRLKPSLHLAAGRWPQAPFEVTVGSGVGLVLGQRIVGAHGVTARRGVPEELHEAHPYVVVGVLARSDTPWDRSLVTPYQSLWLLHGIAAAPAPGSPQIDADETDLRAQVSAVLVKPANFAAAYALKADYAKNGTQSAFPGEVLAQLFGVLADVRTALTILSTIFQALVFAAVLITLIASLPQRTRWLGLLRGLGASRGYVFLALWLQSALIFVVAGLAGLGLGWLGAQALGTWLGGRLAMTIPITWEPGDLAVVAVFWLLGLLGALVPAALGFRVSARKALLRSD